MATNKPKKVVFITGASSGIGAALAIEFSKHDFEVILHGRDKARLQQVALACQKWSKVTMIACDLRESTASENIYQQIRSSYSSIDILVNNAGIGLWDEFDQHEAQAIKELVEVNIVVILQITHLLLSKNMINRGGKIVNIGSVYSFTPVPYQALYAASKAFLLSYSLSLADELRRKHISVTIICPGTTDTLFRQRSPKSIQAPRFAMTASEVASKSYKAIINNTLIYIPGRRNYVFVYLMSWIPYKLKAACVKWFVYRLRGIDYQRKEVNKHD